ncbi:hypothetical protein AFK24_07280 [Pseudomonas syringae]|uniref:Abortive infection protein-like C-terminal domain-containing protein n=1 Tax=Pseudomonas syringae TaxID=317 RepID=A0A1C7Z6S7_PSESX|nr:hypothetical protein [Pseudomonas syringae]OCR25752.1 hypothetical protein AFK24_07280 [Pseudomonas syringae]
MIIDLYSKRQKRLRGEEVDVYTYEDLSESFRVQVSYMIKDLLGDRDKYHQLSEQVQEAYELISDLLRREYGVHNLGESYGGYSHRDPFDELHTFILKEPDTERCLDMVELSCRLGEIQGRKQAYRGMSRASEHIDDCLAELNGRFKAAGYGFEFTNNNIMRIDSELIHSEVVKPAIHFLNVPGFEGAKQEFFGAYEHYRHGNYKEALVDAAKSFESTMKVILKKHGGYKDSDTASKLVLACASQGLIESYHENHLTALVNVLSGGIPTIRNRNAGHGQGADVKKVAPEIVAYGLHLTAAAIVMLASLEAKRA